MDDPHGSTRTAEPHAFSKIHHATTSTTYQTKHSLQQKFNPAMSSTATAPRNRAERRRAAKDAPFLDQTSTGIPLEHPDRSGPKSKTLYELATERQAELEASGFYKDEAKRGSKVNGEDNSQFISSDEDDEPIGPMGDALIYTTSLASVHLTLDVLVFNQYRQDIVWDEIIWKTLRMIPGLYILLFLLKCKTAMRYPNVRQFFFLAASTAAGCYLLHSGNQDGYYAIMKRAPSVGVLWIWSVVEMELLGCAINMCLVGSYMWYNGFSAF
jgi:hypothetical protein